MAEAVKSFTRNKIRGCCVTWILDIYFFFFTVADVLRGVGGSNKKNQAL